MRIWKVATAHLLVIALAGCTSTAKLTPLDRALVKKNITRRSTGGVEIVMDGAFLMNPTAAVETFHTVAEKELGGRPYRYSYIVADKPGIARASAAPRLEPDSKPPSTPPPLGSYTPFYVPRPAGGSGIGSGEAAIILGSLALIILIAQMASKRKSTPASGNPTAEKTLTAPAAPQEAAASTGILQVSGTAEPVAPVALDRDRLVEVILPEGNPAIGRVEPSVGRKIAEEVRRGFESLGCQVLLTERSQKGGYTVRTTVLRAQGNFVQYTNLTLEISLQDQRTGRELARWVVQAGEKPFDLKAQNERLYGGGVATGLLQKPLQMQLRRYLR